jgi:hypothetical protein
LTFAPASGETEIVILVDADVWIDYLRKDKLLPERLLDEDSVLLHPWLL